MRVTSGRDALCTLLLFALPLFEPACSTFPCRLESALLVRRLRDEAGNRDRTSGAVDRHERQIARIRVPTPPGEQFLRFDPHPHFHRRTTDVIDARLEDHQVAEMNWLAKIDSVDRCRYDAGARVAECRDGGGLIHQGENHPAENVPQVVCVLRHHELRRFVLAFLDGLRRAWMLAHACRRMWCRELDLEVAK